MYVAYILGMYKNCAGFKIIILQEKLHSEGTPLTPKDDEVSDKPPSYSDKEVEAQPTSDQSSKYVIM